MTGKTCVVIGSGPAGLMAAEVLADDNVKVIICEAKPSVGRKFLMAGKSGLNLTKDEPDAAFLRAFYEAAPRLTPMLAGMGPRAVMRFAEGLGQDVFTGSSGRVFPTAMKSSPLLRAWLARLAEKGVEIRTRWRWMGFETSGGAKGPGASEPSGRADRHGAGAHMLLFQTPEGAQIINADTTILALGGASWSKLGSDGTWTEILAEQGVAIVPFKPANMGLTVAWSAPMASHFGAPVKDLAFLVGDMHLRGEAVISQKGLEGSGIYAVSRAVREGASLALDLLPNLSLAQVQARLARGRGKASMANHLRKALGLSPAKRALLMEFGRPLPDSQGDLASLIKALPVRHAGPRPLDEAISVAGGVAWDAVDEALMLRDLPGVFCAGEMLDWEAPTGGYLITGCLASGRWAGEQARLWLTRH